MKVTFFDLLPFYAILRSIPNKLLGVIAMFSAILAIMLLPITDLGRTKGFQFRPLSKIAFWVFVANFGILMILGACHVEDPYIELGQISTALYFGYFIVIVPMVSLFESSLLDLSSVNSSSCSSSFILNSITFSPYIILAVVLSFSTLDTLYCMSMDQLTSLDFIEFIQDLLSSDGGSSSSDLSSSGSDTSGTSASSSDDCECLPYRRADGTPALRRPIDGCPVHG